MTPEQLDELERMEAKATKGSWEHCQQTFSHRILPPKHLQYRDDSGYIEIMIEACCECEKERAKDNAALIVSLRNAAPDLIALTRIGLAAVDEVVEDEAGNYAKSFEHEERKVRLIREYLSRKGG